MTRKTIEHGLSEKEKDDYNPPIGVDVSWHDDGTCTIIDTTGTNIEKCKTDLKSKKEVTLKANIMTRDKDGKSLA